jgi:hypothetical protein
MRTLRSLNCSNFCRTAGKSVAGLFVMLLGAAAVFAQTPVEAEAPGGEANLTSCCFSEFCFASSVWYSAW